MGQVSRRAVLSGIGAAGAVTVLGGGQAAAQPVTRSELEMYLAFLQRESLIVAAELGYRFADGLYVPVIPEFNRAYRAAGPVAGRLRAALASIGL